MPLVPPEWDWDLDAPGSRFTWRPAVVVLAGEVSEDGRGSAEDTIRRSAGDWVLKEDVLGKPRFVDGGIGRGAEGWAPVLEWVGLSAAAGVIGSLSWQVVKKIAEAASATVRRLRSGKGEEVSVQVSRGLAVLLAIDEVLERESTAELVVEAADEPSGFADTPVSEINYVGLEPWIVFLVDLKAKKRWIVAVKPNGDVAGALEVALGDFEDMFLRIERRTDEE